MCHYNQTLDSTAVSVLQDPKKRHEMDRKLVEEVLCAMCGDRQPVARHCRKCLASFGAYACLECRFFEVSSVLRTSVLRTLSL